MPKAKVAVTMDSKILERIERLVRSGAHANRSQAIEAAVEAHLDRLAGRRLAAECAKLDPKAERALAEEGFTADADAWPAY